MHSPTSAYRVTCTYMNIRAHNHARIHPRTRTRAETNTRKRVDAHARIARVCDTSVRSHVIG